MTLEEAQKEILRLTDENNTLIAERDDLKTKLNTANNGSADKDKEIERLREHNNTLWQRCSTQPITPKEPPKDEGDDNETEKVKIKSIDEILTEIN